MNLFLKISLSRDRLGGSTPSPAAFSILAASRSSDLANLFSARGFASDLKKIACEIWSSSTTHHYVRDVHILGIPGGTSGKASKRHIFPCTFLIWALVNTRGCPCLVILTHQLPCLVSLHKLVKSCRTARKHSNMKTDCRDIKICTCHHKFSQYVSPHNFFAQKGARREENGPIQRYVIRKKLTH